MMQNKGKKNLTIATLGLGVVSTLLLSGCSSTPDETDKNMQADMVSVDNTPANIGKVFFAQDIELPKGWSEPVQSTVSGDKLTKAQSPRTFVKNDTTCSFSYKVTYYNQNTLGAGDEYTTKNYLYQAARAAGVDTKKTYTKKIAADKEGQTVEFLGMKYNTNYVYYNEKGEPVETDDSSNYYRNTLVRAFDVPVEIGASTEKAAPVAVITYECADKKAYSNKAFNKVVDSLVLNVFSSEVPKPKNQKETESNKSTPTSSTDESNRSDNNKSTKESSKS